MVRKSRIRNFIMEDKLRLAMEEIKYDLPIVISH